jgi:hypothetical protein
LPDTDPRVVEAKTELTSGKGILRTARKVGLGTGTVQRIKREMDLPLAAWKGDA